MSGRPISILIFANSILGIKTLYDWQAKNVDGKGFGSVADRVRTEVGNAPLNDGLVLFWSSCLTVVGCEFRNIRPGDDDRKTAIRVERHLASRIGTKQITFLAVLLKRDRNERPRSYEVLGRRLRDYNGSKGMRTP
jgi:hypothetical protein